MIHINKRPPYRETGMLHTGNTFGKTDRETIEWLERKGITEAWIYQNDEDTRVMSWYE
jgi:hypothetical protein